jgi:predicted HicB family RNase H-like nuclease
MINVLEYNGYQATVEFDADDEVFFGHLAGISDVIGFHGTTVSELKAAFHESVDDYLAFCKEIGKEPNKPYSGKVMFRIDPQVHAKAALAAQLKGISLNQWAEEVLRAASA